MTTDCGTLYGVGVGPGDPELVTVKAYRLMQTAPVIAYPKKRMGEKSYALEIVELYVDRENKTFLGLVFPMTKDEDVLRRQWSETVERVWTHLSAGSDVVFVTEGDPMLYSTFIHMSRMMREQHPEASVRSIPGVSSVHAAASSLGLALADGDETVAIVPASGDRGAMRRAVLAHDCVVFIKVAKVLDDILEMLEETKLIDRAMVCSKATSSSERIWRNARELRGASLNYLTLMVVRK